MQIRVQLEKLFTAALEAAVADGSLALTEVPAPALERPREAANGDWASTGHAQREGCQEGSTGYRRGHRGSSA